MKGDGRVLVVLDLEWTSWEGARKRHWSGPGEEMEIVQIGAVKLADQDGLPEIDAFEVLVRPRINPVLDGYFTNLTGIRQDDVDRDGMDLRAALAAFADFIGGNVGLYGFGDELWHITSNCQLYGLRNPFEGVGCGDVRSLALRHLPDIPRWVNSSDLPQLLGFTPPGKAHQALADSRCVAEAARRLRAIGRI